MLYRHVQDYYRITKRPRGTGLQDLLRYRQCTQYTVCSTVRGKIMILHLF
jgi:hypothetical protein